jgi:hypothetical protein
MGQFLTHLGAKKPKKLSHRFALTGSVVVHPWNAERLVRQLSLGRIPLLIG